MIRRIPWYVWVAMAVGLAAAILWWTGYAQEALAALVVAVLVPGGAVVRRRPAPADEPTLIDVDAPGRVLADPPPASTSVAEAAARADAALDRAGVP